MFVELGNDKAIEGYRDPESDNPDLVRYRTLEGKRVTRVDFPAGTGLQEAYSVVIDGVLPGHMEPGAKPAWVITDSEGLQMLLEEKFDIQGATKPTGWGE